MWSNSISKAVRAEPGQCVHCLEKLLPTSYLIFTRSLYSWSKSYKPQIIVFAKVLKKTKMVDYAKMVVFANALKLKCRCAHIGTRSSLSFFSQPPFKLTLKERRKRVKVTKGDIRCLSAENSRQLSRAANHLLHYHYQTQTTIRTVWKVSEETGKFPDSLESFQTFWKFSEQTGKFPDSLETFRPFKNSHKIKSDHILSV